MLNTLRRVHFQRKGYLILIATTISIFSLALTLHAIAQSDTGPWTTPTNVSKSGAASQPAIAVAPNGTLHVLWWDATEGEQYARSTNVTATIWTPPAAAPSIVGARLIDATTGRVTLIPPSQLQMLATERGDVYAFWRNANGSLQTAQTVGTNWSNAITLTQAAGAMGAMADVSGTLHLAYAKLSNDSDGPAGIYYRANGGTHWTAPNLIYGSPYFRTAKPEEVLASVAGDGQGRVIVTWNDPHVKQSFYSRSGDGGATWDKPQVVNGTLGSPAAQLHIAVTPSSEFLLLWQEVGAEGCGMTQRQSMDGGQTWSAPERVLGNLKGCPVRWSFAPNKSDGNVWLISSAAPDSRNANLITFAVWNGSRWSEPDDTAINIYDATSQNGVSLNCLNADLVDKTVGLIGCDPKGDVWVARNAVEPDRLISALSPTWRPVEILSNRAGPAASEGLPALTVDGEGDLYALWSQATAVGQPGTALYSAVQSNDRWSRPVQLFAQSNATARSTASKADQPSIAADDTGRIHAVWSSGTSGEISYSWAYTRDVASNQAWATPITLPVPTALSQWPDIVTDPGSNTLHVIYAVPYNERRGIYLVQSRNGGATWSQPVAVFDAAEAKWDSVSKPRLALDPGSKVLHAVWLRAAVPGSVAPQAVLYSRSADGGQSWSTPIQIAEGAVDWPRVAVTGPNQIYLTWVQAAPEHRDSSTVPLGVWGQFSPDGGMRWTEAAAIQGFEQVSGPIDLAADGAGRLYLAGIGQSPNSESTLLVTQWDGQSWGEGEAFELGQAATVGNAVKLAIAPQAGRLGALLRTWVWDQSGTGQFEVTTTNRSITTTSPIAPAPTLTPLPSPTPGPTAQPQSTATPAPQLASDVRQPTLGSSGPGPLVVGGLLATVIVVVVVGRTIWLKRR